MLISETFVSPRSLLLTVFNRHKFTKRWLDFAQYSKIKFKIFLCDGGKDNELTNYINLKKYGDLDITYYKSKYYENYKNFWVKFYESLKL